MHPMFNVLVFMLIVWSCWALWIKTKDEFVLYVGIALLILCGMIGLARNMLGG